MATTTDITQFPQNEINLTRQSVFAVFFPAGFTCLVFQLCLADPT